MSLDHSPVHHGPAHHSSVRPEDLVEHDRVQTPLYEDAALFEQEMEKIFAHSWVFVAHGSEVPEKGSFILSWVGQQPVIVVRDRKGDINVLVNRCRHRAATVCEVKKGKTSSFQCPYHGWGYGLDGSLRGVPYPEQYGKDFDKSALGMKALRVESYQNMIFATLDDGIEPLVDFLGPAKKWIDLFMKQGGGYPVKVLGEHQFTVPMNWKIQLENTTDAYHFPVVHKSFIQSLDKEAEATFNFFDKAGFVEDLGNGHSVAVMIPELIDLDENLDDPIPERFEELAQALRDEGFDEPRVRKIVRATGGAGFNLNLFPNVSLSLAFFRVLRPVGVKETAIRHVCLGMDGGPAAANRMRIRLQEHFQGPMGFGTPDDAEVWERVQRGTLGGKDLPILVNRGLVDEVPGVDGPRGHLSAETGMRASYQMWKRMMAQ
ncbi:phenylpropionate dioxygenase-like ring-hydroxylating dioxygenase large terminal subunit [Azospirillum lipoferum]|uniref:Aromatic ring-hydroxylating dioxygenase subunit alpha n=1 Tax=Azospirillum lipoferum TaxID=193 RepID=A0A5A9GPF1_AZOLI|nr:MULTISPECIES: aromatic ring-hydroxylating dioxygenase subunit alpha [Azospirillum]KAA0595612.1 aromatic ring-hydroxylating dioxygenase subunit alpha [Azospirillum lipoferum]MCP1611536.1 phenylpropionate dioxygenase-like ring-hydroxylating dioxygenase large terminal subunit [Azospirillum lipoferum]MDW5537335.1 aromatic ring-hydroxylating dioxygenase subunit alpha [Azospirillum sp. NL1]